MSLANLAKEEAIDSMESLSSGYTVGKDKYHYLAR